MHQGGLVLEHNILAGIHVFMTHLILLLVLILVEFMNIPHITLLRVTVNSYSVLGLRPVILHGLVLHAAQPGECGVQLTEVVMSLGSLGCLHCRVTILHDSAFANTIVGVRSPRKDIITSYNSKP